MNALARLVLLRGRTQRVLLAAVLAVLVLGTSVLGLCALLLTTAQDRALGAALQRAPARDVRVTATFEVIRDDAPAVIDDATTFLTRALAPVGSTTSVWQNSRLRALSGGPADEVRMAYLGASLDVARNATLVSGRWPTASEAAPDADGGWAAALPASAAEHLGLHVGSRVRLPVLPDGTETSDATAAAPIVLHLVGTFRPAPGSEAWQRDLLGGAGFAQQWERPGSNGTVLLPAYGPFVVRPEALEQSRAGVSAVSLIARPRLGPGTPAAAVDQVRVAVATAGRDLSTRLTGRAAYVVVASDLPGTLDADAAQQRVIRSVVLVVALLAGALAVTALGLAGRLVAARRSAETALLTARGAARRQLAAQAAGEALVLALVGTALAVPLALGGYRLLTRLPVLADAGLGGPVGASTTLVVTAACGALAQASALVAPALRATDRRRSGRESRRGVAARSAADLLLLALAVAAVLQLRATPYTVGGGADPVLVSTPVLCLLAGSVLVLRLLPVVRTLAERHAGRSRHLVGPFAGWQLARRATATSAVLLLVLATAGATFAVGFGATWSRSQHDQADARVGTDLTAAPRTAGGAERAALTTRLGGTVVPVTHRQVQLGTFAGTGTGSSGTSLVALDTRTTSGVLRGRLPNGTPWSRYTARLSPGAALRGLPLDPAATTLHLQLTGTTDPADLVLRATPTVLLQDERGSRTGVRGPGVLLDGRPHDLALRLTEPAGHSTVVGLILNAALEPASDIPKETDFAVATRLTLRLTSGAGAQPGTTERPNGGWSLSAAAGTGDWLTGGSATLSREAGVDVITARPRIAATDLVTGPLDLVLGARPRSAPVPVVVSRSLATATGAHAGDRLSLALGSTTIPARIAAIAPYVPSEPRDAAVLADYAALSGAALAHGNRADLTDAWWVGGVHDQEAAAAAARAFGLHGVETRDAVARDLRDGPLRVGLRAALWVLLAAACLLALAGTALNTAAELESRVVETARLQALGLGRRSLVGAVLIEQTVRTLLAVLPGAVVGYVVAGIVAPLLAVSETGAGPVPVAVPAWAWPAGATATAGLLVGCAAVVAPLAYALVRRAALGHLRLGES